MGRAGWGEPREPLRGGVIGPARRIADIGRVLHSAAMLPQRAFLTMVFVVSLAGAAMAQPAAELREPARLRGLTSAEAETIIRNLQAAQRRLRDGESLFFELLSGAPASYSMTMVSPRDAFLRMAFESPTSIERVQTTNRLWQLYKLIFEPNGPG